MVHLPLRWPSGRVILVACALAVFVAAGLLAAPRAAGAIVDRDAFSTTVKTAGGGFKTSVSAQPMNYRDDSGVWHEIDTQLEEVAGGDLQPKSVDGDVTIPESLSQPIELEHDGKAVSLRLIGADAEAEIDVDGAAASFDGALLGVEARYLARPDGVKETLTLATPFAPRVFNYELKAYSTWAASAEDGDIVLRDSSGTERYRLSAPLAWDSAADPSFTDELDLSVLRVADGRWRVTLRPDPAWLADPTRTYPVTVDPDFYWVGPDTTRFHGATTDCQIAGGTQANAKSCSWPTMYTGYSSRPYRALFKFDVGAAIPTNADVSAATFLAYSPGSYTHPSADFRLHTVTSDWDNNATWNNRKNGTPWTSAGGDYSATPSLTSGPTVVNNAGYWYYWQAPVPAVQAWVDGTLPNYGFLLKTDSTTGPYGWVSTEDDQSEWPALDVTWSLPASDTTPPPVPTGLKSDWNEDADELIVGYTQLADAAGPEGPASGLLRNEYRVALDGLGYSSWETAPDEEFPLSEIDLGRTVAVEMRAVDVAGNVSMAAAKTWTVGMEIDGQSPDMTAIGSFVDDYGVSVATAASWLDQQKEHGNVLGAIGRSDVGGLWFDNELRVTHIQATTSAGAAAASQYVATHSLPNTVVDTVPATEAQLDAAADAAQTTLDDLVEVGRVDISRRTSTTTVDFVTASTISPSELSRVQAARSAASTPTTLTTSELSDLRFEPLAAECHRLKPAYWRRTDSDARKHSAQRCNDPVRGGQVIGAGTTKADGSICTAGFSIRIGSEPALLTAGHCGKGNDGETGDWYAPSASRGNGAVDRFGVGRKFVNRWNGPDWGVIDSVVGGLPSYIVREASSTGSVLRNERYQITGMARSIEGKRVCLMGAVYGSRCGKITELGLRHGQVARFVSCGSDHGDSGGPVTADNKAYGVLSGTRGILGISVDKCALEYQSVSKALEGIAEYADEETFLTQGTSTATPTALMLTPPQIQGCYAGTTTCTTDPGTWAGNPTIEFARSRCTSLAECGTLTSDPHPRVSTVSSGGCPAGLPIVTVVATTPAGRVFVPLRGQVGPPQCDQ